MRKHTGGLLYVAAGILLGAMSAYVAANQAGQEPLAKDSPWHSRTAALDGMLGIYVQDYYLMAERLPLAPGQLVEADASADGDGNGLSPACRYEVVSSGALPRWWSIAASAGNRPSLSVQSTVDSGTVVRNADGTVRITASAVPQPGNWLKVEAGQRFTLLYAAVPTGSRNARTAPPFTIRQAGC